MQEKTKSRLNETLLISIVLTIHVNDTFLIEKFII
jgi:hypothetical protein